MTNYKNLISIGVDVGSKNGAIAIITSGMEILYLAKAPFYVTEIKSKRLKPKLNKETGMFEADYKKRSWTDFKVLREIYQPYLKKDIIYTVEKVMPGRGELETNSFIFGNSLGVHQGLYAYLNPIHYEEPRPQVWKKDLGLTSDKQGSIDLVEKVFGVNLRTYLPKGKLDDVAEALLLSAYGLKSYLTKINEI